MQRFFSAFYKLFSLFCLICQWNSLNLCFECVNHVIYTHFEAINAAARARIITITIKNTYKNYEQDRTYREDSSRC